MRITDDYQDYHFTSSIKGRHHLVPRKHRIEKICEEEFGEELEEAIHQQNPNLRRKVHSTTIPFSTATPDKAKKPTAAEIDKGIPRIQSQRNPLIFF